MVLGTDTGELLIIDGTELKATLQLDPGSTVHSIAAYAKVSSLCVALLESGSGLAYLANAQTLEGHRRVCKRSCAHATLLVYKLLRMPGLEGRQLG